MELVLVAVVALVVAGIAKLLGRSARAKRARGQRSISPESWTPAYRLWWPEVEEPVPRTPVAAQHEPNDLPDKTPSG